VQLAPVQVAACARYSELLCEWNQRFNLTAIENPDEILVKHFLDSLSCAAVVDFTTRTTLVDVGTGAGFPGLVLKIAYPHLRVTLLDAVQKRLGFLERVVSELALTDVRTVHARAEDAARPRRPAADSAPAPASASVANLPPLREAFDVATARAVARLNVLSEWLLPFVRVGGVAISMKGPEVASEAEEAANALRTLGGRVVDVRELTLPHTGVRRSLVVIRKERPTPASFPRGPGTARRSPL
jgi:16S rRNA (guanine527-N7)-methyltransferase